MCAGADSSERSEGRRSLLTRITSLVLLGQVLPAHLVSAAPEASDEEIREAIRKAFDKTAGKTKVKPIGLLWECNLSEAERRL